MPHAEIDFLRFYPLVWILIEPNLFHLILDVILELQISLLLLNVRIVLVFPLNLFGLFNAKQSMYLCLIVLYNGWVFLLLLLLHDLLSFKLFYLFVIFKAKAVPDNLSWLVLALFLDDF